jgi:hypothetical protein
MSGRCDCGALDCSYCYPGPRPRTEDERPRGSWWWPGEGAGRQHRRKVQCPGCKNVTEYHGEMAEDVAECLHCGWEIAINENTLKGSGRAFVLPDAPPDDWACAHCGALVSDHGSLVDDEWIELANEDPDRKDSWICGMCGEEKFLPPNEQKGSEK